MTRTGYAVSTLLFVVVLVGKALSQERSLTKLPAGETFMSADYGFSVALFKEPSEVIKRNGSTEYRWTLKEGRFTIEVGRYLTDDLAFSEQTRAGFLRGYKEGFMKQSYIKFVSESPAPIGSYRGTTFVLDIPGQNLHIRDTELTSGRRFASIIAGSYTNVSGSEALILKVLKSQTLTATTN